MYLLTAVGLTPGGSSPVHIFTQTIHRTTQYLGRVLAIPRLSEDVLRLLFTKITQFIDRGSTVVKVLCYKSDGRWFDPRWCQCIFHSHKFLPIAVWPWGRLSLQQKWVPGVFPGGKGGRCVRLRTYHHPVPLSWNLGTLTSCNPLGHTRTVTGLIYLCFYIVL